MCPLVALMHYQVAAITAWGLSGTGISLESIISIRRKGYKGHVDTRVVHGKRERVIKSTDRCKEKRKKLYIDARVVHGKGLSN